MDDNSKTWNILPNFFFDQFYEFHLENIWPTVVGIILEHSV